MINGVTLNTAGCDASQLVAAARAAEAAGFDSVWCYDHLSGSVLGRGPCPDVWTLLGALAVATERVALGPLVANVTTRHPVQLALAAATLQDLAGGRAQLGLGAGASAPSPFAAELTMFGLVQEPAERRRARLAETIGFLRALWSGAPSFEGTWASLRDVHGVAIPEPACPIVVGANGPKMAELAGWLADGVNFHSWEGDLPRLVGIAVEAAALAGRTAFSVSVEVPLERTWLDPDGDERGRLSELGVNEVMAMWNADVDPSTLRDAGGWLR